ncbi:arsenate-mycothiol transferase ArsC [Bradyrhizobium cenepequi]|uniref:arsenate-mycothiol transferase ArsC n=1 Tax=Bradyrhizobium cenepequi TaxID=2821403 RepID=UPI001CE35907|nr:low molecular weight phosphatase family protein [Bradyrhizobium cenepequi]MCA6107869.1 low molecular weight phosphatase family protein [Bradyrhizobium cenepequi]
MAHRLLFLCTGNYYRSRYAEELFNHRAGLADLKWRAFSRGAAEKGSPDNVGPMSPFALEGLEAKGILPAGNLRYPQPCTSPDLESADLIIALKEAEHRPLLERRFPGTASRVIYWHVDDVDIAKPAVALALIDDLIDDLLNSLSDDRLP